MRISGAARVTASWGQARGALPISAASLFCAAVLLSSVGCEILAGPRWAINRAVDDIAATGVVCEETATSLSLRFVGRTVDVEGDRATVFARGEVRGKVHGIDTSCICVEAIPLVREAGSWRVVGFPLARLRGVLDALERRVDAFEKKDVDAYRELMHPDYLVSLDGASLEARLTGVMDGGEDYRLRIVGRTLRVERHEAIATEDWVLLEGVPEREVASGRARYSLVPFADGWRFSAGLM